MEREILDKASLYLFCETLGFEEGKFYFHSIKKENKLLDQDYSRSKKYRILKKLFELGAIAKIGVDGDNTKYLPLPPTFIIEKVKNKNLFLNLESIYLKNYYNGLLENLNKKHCLYISIKGHKNSSLILFLLKYFMKKQAIILMGGINEYEFYLKNLDKEKIKKIKYFYREDYIPSKEYDNATKIKGSKIGNRRMAIIDNKILIEFLKFPNHDFFNHPEEAIFMGYMVGPNFEITTSKGKENYVHLIKKETEELIRL